MAGTPGRDEKRREKENQSYSRPLHNFTLPFQLKWGNRKQLRCFKSSSPSSVPCSDQQRRQQGKSPTGDGKEIEFVYNKLLNDLKLEAAGPLKQLPIIYDKEKEEEEEDSKNKTNGGEKKPSEEELPWNLRTRRATGKAINDCGNVVSSPLKRQDKGLKVLSAVDKVEAAVGGGGGGDQPPSLWPKFSPTLSKEEIETDFIFMTGAKPPKKPKKRAKNVMKQLSVLVPGYFLTEVTPENYKVSEPTEPEV